jgi:hypothetical protein
LGNSNTAGAPLDGPAVRVLLFVFVRLVLLVSVVAATVFPEDGWLGTVEAAGQASRAPVRPYTAPRTADGQPDLQGIWQALNTAAWDIQDHAEQRFPGLPPRFSVPAGQGVVEGNEIPYQPWAKVRRDENLKNRVDADPEAKCYMPGVPRVTYMPYPFQILQYRDRVVILYEHQHVTREIFTDGSPHSNLQTEFWMGDSRGRWDGESLVVDVTKFTDDTWFDRAGNFHSEALHVVERYTPVGPDHLRYEATIEDPKVFTRPWTMSMPLYRRQEPGVQILENECYALARDPSAQEAK